MVTRGSISIEFHSTGDLSYDDQVQMLMDVAHIIHNEIDVHAVVADLGGIQTLPYTTTSDGVFCEGCADGIYSGIRWPTAANCDNSRAWVERCDICQQYESDYDALQALAEIYSGVTSFVMGEDYPAGSRTLTPYFEVP
jgi:hypothetical protein